MQMTKKITSIVLAVLMVVSMMSVMAVSTASAATYVAKIGSTKYETLEAAFAAAKDGDTITVLADCAGNGIKVTPEGKFTTGLTVDFNNHTYTVDGETVGSTGTETNGFQLLKNNKVTFKNGTITSAKAKILVQNYSNLTLDKMTLTLNNSSYSSAYTLSNNNGNTVIKDSTINANPAGGYAFDVCRFSTYPSVSVTVNGASVINGNVEISASKSDLKDGLSLNFESGKITGTVVVDASAQAASAADTSGKYSITNHSTPVDPVAKIGDTGYATLADAFAAAQDGDTITVLADCSGNGIKVTPEGKFTTGLTVDFNNHTYTVIANTVGSTGTETQAFQLLKDNKITFQNGTITSSVAKMLVQNYSNLTLDNMVLDGRNLVSSGVYTLSNNNGNIVINDTTIYAKGGKGSGNYAFDVCRYASYPSVNVTVTGNSEINGDVEISASKSNPMNGFSLTLESGTLNGDIVVDKTAQNVINATPDKVEVTKKNTFNQEAPLGYEWVDNGNGTSSIAPATTNPLDALMDKVADGNQFGINSQYLAGTLLGVQKKEAIADADVTSEKGKQEAEEGDDVRFVAVLDTDLINDPEVTDYGFVLAKANSKNAYSGVNFDNLKAHFGNGEKTISAKGTYNNICGNEAYGNPEADTPYKYITCAVNGMSDDDMVVARFYVVKDGKTYYAKYAGHNYKYTGCMTKADLAAVAD
ncbi:MAG: hypothetical protein VZQ55_08265 [Ruminococcus sp.]|nr:hypothetical protein [Ruminococcus sp.]